MSSPPAVSIVLPTRNGSRFLDQAIESVVSQTWSDWELIIVDDASTDDTPDKIVGWAARDRRIRIISLTESRKLPGALNDGFRHASGSLWTWTSDDNWYHREALQRLHDVLASRPELDVIYADSCWVDENGVILRRFQTQPPESLIAGNCVGACFLYRREVQESLRGYDESLFLVEDYDFWLRAAHRFRLEPLHEVLYYYRVHGDSLTSQRKQDIARATAKALGLWLPQATWLSRTARGRGYLRLAQLQMELGMNSAGRKNLLRAMRAARRPLLFPGVRSLLIDLVFGPSIGNMVRSLRNRPG